MYYGRWYGGSSYSVGEMPDILERFKSIEAAKDALRDRRDHGYWEPQDFDYVTREAESSLLPAVGDDSEIQLYNVGKTDVDPNEWSDPYPDLRVFFGPRGGVRVEPC